jgi:hypothetical protein
LAGFGRPDNSWAASQNRKGLIALARDGSVVCRVTRRANALVLLDAGKSCQEVAEVLLFDDEDSFEPSRHRRAATSLPRKRREWAEAPTQDDKAAAESAERQVVAGNTNVGSSPGRGSGVCYFAM